MPKLECYQGIIVRDLETGKKKILHFTGDVEEADVVVDICKKECSHIDDTVALIHIRWNNAHSLVLFKIETLNEFYITLEPTEADIVDVIDDVKRSFVLANGLDYLLDDLLQLLEELENKYFHEVLVVNLEETEDDAAPILNSDIPNIQLPDFFYEI